MITTRLLRHINSLRCLRLLQDGRTMSRADMARALGQTRASVGNAIVELVQAGLVVEDADATSESRVGRPGIGVRLNAEGAFFVGIDIGTRVITGVVMDLQMTVVGRVVELVGDNYRNPEYVLARLLAIKDEVIARSGVARDKIQGLAVSVPGVVGYDGSVVHAPFLEWQNFPLRDRILPSCPEEWVTEVRNDAFAFASAELSVTDPAMAQNMLVLLMAEGIGSAAISDGKLITGAHGYAGELGHMAISVKGRAESFEELAGAKSFPTYMTAGMSVMEGVERLIAEIPSGKANSTLEFWAEALAHGLANAIHFMDPAQIVLGGPLASLFPYVSDRVDALLETLLLKGFIVPSIKVASFGPDGAAIGAAATIRERIFSMPDLEEAASSIP
jgi:predicted NBD/HSP70 family sugar kinase